MHTSFSKKPYPNHAMALNVRKSDKVKGINCTLLVLTTRTYTLINH